jgi:hypothetical protein
VDNFFDFPLAWDWPRLLFLLDFCSLS